MPYKVKNVALDHTKTHLRRTAAKLEMEPNIAGLRLRLRTSMTISDEQFESNKVNLEKYVGWGVVEIERFRDVPTVEEVLAAGYTAEAAVKIVAEQKALADAEAATPVKAAEPEAPVVVPVPEETKLAEVVAPAPEPVVVPVEEPVKPVQQTQQFSKPQQHQNQKNKK